eukprot:gene100-biopygen182
MSGYEGGITEGAFLVTCRGHVGASSAHVRNWKQYSPDAGTEVARQHLTQRCVPEMSVTRVCTHGIAPALDLGEDGLVGRAAEGRGAAEHHVGDHADGPENGRGDPTRFLDTLGMTELWERRLKAGRQASCSNPRVRVLAQTSGRGLGCGWLIWARVGLSLGWESDPNFGSGSALGPSDPRLGRVRNRFMCEAVKPNGRTWCMRKDTLHCDSASIFAGGSAAVVVVASLLPGTQPLEVYADASEKARLKMIDFGLSKVFSPTIPMTALTVQLAQTRDSASAAQKGGAGREVTRHGRTRMI